MRRVLFAPPDIQQTDRHQLHETSGLAGSLLFLACRNLLLSDCGIYAADILLCRQAAGSLKPAHPCNSLRVISHRQKTFQKVPVLANQV